MDRDAIAGMGVMCEAALVLEAEAVKDDDLYAAADWADAAERWSRLAFSAAGAP